MTMRSPVPVLLILVFSATVILGVLLASWELMAVAGLALVAAYVLNRSLYLFPRRTAFILAVVYAVMWALWFLNRSVA
jgi:hypothetical protein